MTRSPVRWTEVFRSRRMAVLAALGFSSGLPLMLTGSTLSLWLTDAHVDRTKIAAFTLVGLAYTFKFTWAPLIDRYSLPFLGRRRGWMLLTQLGLVAAIAVMGLSNPAVDPARIALLAVIVAFCSASQDVVLDAYGTDLLTPEQRPAGSAIYVFGYRVAMLVTGTLALVLADHVSWRVVYEVMAALMGIGIVATLLAEEPEASREVRPRTLFHAVYLPFARFFSRFGIKDAALLLIFAATYKFGDFLLDALKMNFYRDELHFTKTVIGTFNKAFGFAAVAAGGFTVGVLAPRLGVRRSLLVFGIVQALTNLLYVLLAAVGKSYPMLAAAVFFDNYAGAMGSAVFVALLMSLCDKQVSATQYALLTSLSSVGLRLFGWTSGPLQGSFGWSGFFVITALMAIPGLLLIPLLKIPSANPAAIPVATVDP